MNVERRQAAADHQTKPPDLGCESACRLLSSTTTIAIYYYYSTRKLILIYRPTEGRRLNWPRHCRKRSTQPVPMQGCKSQCFYDKHNSCRQRDSISGPRAYTSSGILPLDHCDLIRRPRAIHWSRITTCRAIIPIKQRCAYKLYGG